MRSRRKVKKNFSKTSENCSPIHNSIVRQSVFLKMLCKLRIQRGLSVNLFYSFAYKLNYDVIVYCIVYLSMYVCMGAYLVEQGNRIQFVFCNKNI